MRTTDVALSDVTATERTWPSGDARHELDRVDSTLGRDAEPRQEAKPVRVPGVLDRRDRRDVDLAGEEHPVELGRDAGHLLDLVRQTMEDRRHVHVRDAAEPDHWLIQR